MKHIVSDIPWIGFTHQSTWIQSYYYDAQCIWFLVFVLFLRVFISHEAQKALSLQIAHARQGVFSKQSEEFPIFISKINLEILFRKCVCLICV